MSNSDNSLVTKESCNYRVYACIKFKGTQEWCSALTAYFWHTVPNVQQSSQYIHTRCTKIFLLCVLQNRLIRLGFNLLFWTTITIYREGKQLQSLGISCFIGNTISSKKRDALPAMNQKTYDYILTIIRSIEEKRTYTSITVL